MGLCKLQLSQCQCISDTEFLNASFLIVTLCVVSFLEDVSRRMKETKQLRLEQPLLYLQLQIARTKLDSGDLAGCASAIDEGKDDLDAMNDVSRILPPYPLACYWSLNSDWLSSPGFRLSISLPFAN